MKDALRKGYRGTAYLHPDRKDRILQELKFITDKNYQSELQFSKKQTCT
jgi:hypothetical protein